MNITFGMTLNKAFYKDSWTCYLSHHVKQSRWFANLVKRMPVTRTSNLQLNKMDEGAFRNVSIRFGFVNHIRVVRLCDI